MGVSTMVVLICSNIIISLLKNIIPDKVRIPCYILVRSTFVTIVQLMLKAFLPELDSALGLYIPLIVVNCIILGRAEMFASKNSVVDSALDGIGMEMCIRDRDKGIEVKPLPKNMYVAMSIGSVLCILYGVFPDLLYRFLPYDFEYHPFTWDHIMQYVQLLVTGVVPFIMYLELSLIHI